MIFNGRIEELFPIIASWEKECNGVEMGLDLDWATFIAELQGLINGEDSDLLVLRENVGCLGLQVINSPIGRNKIANEHFWYVLPEHRGIASLRLIREAENWAKKKGCSHLILNASTLASSLHDNVCKLYERFGMQKFETSYIKVL